VNGHVSWNSLIGVTEPPKAITSSPVLQELGEDSDSYGGSEEEGEQSEKDGEPYGPSEDEDVVEEQN
jgi:hypothetical protein